MSGAMISPPEIPVSTPLLNWHLRSFGFDSELARESRPFGTLREWNAHPSGVLRCQNHTQSTGQAMTGLHQLRSARGYKPLTPPVPIV